MEPLKKDPMGMGLDIPICKYRWLTMLTNEELQTLYDLMGEDVQPRKDFVFSKIDFSEIKE